MKLTVPQMASMSHLLDEALDLDEAGRQRWLQLLPAEHQELVPYLREALLPRQAATLAPLPKLTLAFDAAAPPAASRLQPGAAVGPYELIRVLGAGGMAQVWLARRADGAFKREVALKLPMLHAHRADLAERFTRERDILAGLEHPHIARLYDAGVDTDGLPYLSMEYVSGEALTDWCDMRHLEITERLDLFLQVLSAVQYAHERQVIHRDLKPSNILVTQEGQVRLLDFGVAKLLESSDQAPLTELHGRALTPDYASPELLCGEPVDDRSDVYSLGVLLYELLTGRRPYQLNRAASLGLLEPAIVTVDPKRPSLQLGQSSALARRLRGDLDEIVLKALAKDPARRYPTVQALAQDVKRYLKGRPVEARRASLGYRAWKFILRHQAAVAAITIAAVVILMTVAFVLRREGGLTPVAAFSPAAQSVAVLPFVDLSESHDQEFFSDGLTEELLDRLAKVPDLRVIASTSSFSFKGKPDDIPMIARELNVANILKGSVRKSGRRLRVTTHLVRAATGEALWSETYDRELQDVFQVQDEIAVAVTRALKLKLAAERPASSPHRTANTEAYTQYLLGRQFVRSDTLESAQLAIKAFHQAIDLDPEYAAAYAGLALAQTFVALGTDQALSDALASANEAIALAPDEPGGYVARGEIRLSFFWDWTGAQADFEKALAIEPADSDAVRRYGAMLANLGRLPEALAALKQATELDPLSARAWRELGYYYLVNGSAAEAHEAYSRARDVHPESSYAPYSFAREALLAGRPGEALASFRLVARDTMRLVGVALAEQALGHDSQSRQALDELIAKGAQTFAYQIAEVYARRGDPDRAFAWLERAYQQRDPGLTRVKIDPFLISLHGDPRFEALLAKIHLQ